MEKKSISLPKEGKWLVPIPNLKKKIKRLLLTKKDQKLPAPLK